MIDRTVDPAKYEINAALVRRILDYDPAMGVFTWRRNADRPPNWNGRYAGRQAGYVNSYDRRVIAIFQGKKRRYYASVLAWLHMTGEWPCDEIDHVNLVSYDDRWENLRAATASQNKCNRGAKRGSHLGVKGVHFDTSRGKFYAQIQIDKTRHRLGRFQTLDEAKAAYDNAARIFHGKFARTA